MNVVLFLGAGFSRAYGLPVMKEFFQCAKNASYLTDDDKNFLQKQRKKVQRAVNMLEVRHDNLEDTLSFCLASENFSGGYPEATSKDYQKLCYILQKVYSHVEFGGFKKYSALPLSYLEELLGFYRNRYKQIPYNLTIVTTNYDVTLEYNLWRLGLPCSLPNMWTARPQTNYTSYGQLYSDERKKGPLLCKLHGSLNWFSYPENRKKLHIDSCILGVDKTDDNGVPSGGQGHFPQIAEPNYDPVSVPFIIPPTLFKLQTDSRIQAIWDAAAEALKQADKLVFVGYSFPDSDIYMRYFLAANLYENVDLEPILIIDPDANNICERLKNSQFGMHFRDRLNPIPDKWESSHYTIP